MFKHIIPVLSPVGIHSDLPLLDPGCELQAAFTLPGDMTLPCGMTRMGLPYHVYYNKVFDFMLAICSSWSGSIPVPVKAGASSKINVCMPVSVAAEIQYSSAETHFMARLTRKLDCSHPLPLNPLIR